MSKWVTSFGVPTSYVTDSFFNIVEDTTVRYAYFNNLDGTKVRFNFSNVYGKHNAEIEKMTLAERVGKKVDIDLSTLREITFNKNGNVIPAGGTLTSDEIDFISTPGKTYVLSIYFKKLTYSETGYTNPGANKENICFYSRGERTDVEQFAGRYTVETKDCLFLSGVDVYTKDESYAIVAFGDSITARPWPDFLEYKLFSEGKTNISVVRRAMGGNRVLGDYGDYSLRRRMGEAARKRAERDLSSVSGAKELVFLEGINDIMHPGSSVYCTVEELPEPQKLIDGYCEVFEVAKKQNLKIFQGTVMPTERLLEDTEHDRSQIRLDVNKWIRNNDVTDGVVDFDLNMKDKENPLILSEEYDSGDKLHPSQDGSLFMADLVYKKLF